MVQQITKAPVIYPERDGLPMSDNTLQFKWIVKIKENLEILFAERADVFVAGDLLWYPVEGNNRIRRAPDAMVAFGAAKGDRGSYQQWRENNIAPQVVFEILSPGNRMAEMVAKYQFYDRYGVEEYYVYDPDRVELTGWQRREGELAAIEPISGWISPRLGIRFELGENLEIFRPDGELFRSSVEIAQQAERDRAEAQRQRAEAQLQRAEAEAQRAEAKTQRAVAEAQQAEAQTQRAAAEAQQAEAQRQKERADALAAKLQELGIEVD
jgi:Uma2 family endonuclease